MPSAFGSIRSKSRRRSPAGNTSRVIQTPEGYVVFKCDERIPADSNVKLDEVRAALVKEVAEMIREEWREGEARIAALRWVYPSRVRTAGKAG